PTISPPPITEAGIIVGTAAYMSPEQARGHAVDKRTDIWAFACVLYEMLTGKRAFAGESMSDTLANVLKSPVNWEALPTSTPRPIRRLLQRSLEKERKRRLADIADARLEIDEASSASLYDREAAAAGGTQRAAWTRVLPWAVSSMLAVLAAFLLTTWSP